MLSVIIVAGLRVEMPLCPGDTVPTHDLLHRTLCQLHDMGRDAITREDPVLHCIMWITANKLLSTPQPRAHTPPLSYPTHFSAPCFPRLARPPPAVRKLSVTVSISHASSARAYVCVLRASAHTQVSYAPAAAAVTAHGTARHHTRTQGRWRARRGLHEVRTNFTMRTSAVGRLKHPPSTPPSS